MRRSFNCRRTCLVFGSMLCMVLSDVSRQWLIQKPPTRADLHSIDAISDAVAWVSGSDGTILRTNDGGRDWHLCSIPPGGARLDFRGIQALSDQTAIVMSTGKGDLSRLYKTTDACRSWKLVFTNPDREGSWAAIQFAERKSLARGKCFGLVLGQPVANRFPLFLTLDCGDSWERRKTLPIALPGEVVFAESNAALYLGQGVDRFVTGGITGARTLQFMTYVDFFPLPYRPKPTNRPPYQINLWFAEKIPEARPSSSAGAYSMGWADDDHGPVIVGGDAKHPDQVRSTAWRVSYADDRAGLVAAERGPRGFRSAVAYDASRKTWFAVGPTGTDISTDHGVHWHALLPSLKEGNETGADRNWNALSLPYVVGPNGRIGKLRESSLETNKHVR